MLFRIGHGYDVDALAEGLPLVRGGVGIEHDKGCVAHSDGDVVIHALCDALLGAAALGDIGLHFPDTSADFAGSDSKILLRRVAELLREKGYNVKYFYGGNSYFDNMEPFFSGNGYDIVDQRQYAPEEISFANIWGVCDEDAYR